MASGKTLADARRKAQANVKGPAQRLVEGQNCIVVRERIEHAAPKTEFGNELRGATRDRTLVPTYMRGNGKVGNSAEVSNGGEHGDNSDEAVVIEDDDDDEYIEPPRQTNKRKRETSARAPRQGPKQKRRNVEKEVFSPSANSRGSTNRMLVPWHRHEAIARLFLFTYYYCNKDGIDLPMQSALNGWLGRGHGVGAFAQQMTKYRTKFLRQGFLVPPRFEGIGKGKIDENIRGFVLADNGAGGMRERAVTVFEEFKDRKEPLPGTEDTGSGKYMADPVTREAATKKRDIAYTIKAAIKDSHLGYLKIQKGLEEAGGKEVYYLAKQKDGKAEYRIFKVIGKKAHLMLLLGSEDSLIFSQK